MPLPCVGAGRLTFNIVRRKDNGRADKGDNGCHCTPNRMAPATASFTMALRHVLRPLPIKSHSNYHKGEKC